MPIITFSEPVPFPIGALREALTSHFPDYKWQCGDGDTGALEQLSTYADNDVIMGRSGVEMVMIGLKAHIGVVSGNAPPHECYVELGTPTTEDTKLADRLCVLICGVLMNQEPEQVYCQLVPGGNWFDIDALDEGLKAVINGCPLDQINGGMSANGNKPESRYDNMSPNQAIMGAKIDEILARVSNEHGMGDTMEMLGIAKPPEFSDQQPRHNALPTQVILATTPLALDWANAEGAINAVDPEGHWRVSPSGPSTATLYGRGGTITVSASDTPLPDYLLSPAMIRQYEITDERRRSFAEHGAHHAIMADLDTRSAAYEDVRQTAMVISMLMALSSMQPQFRGLYNAGTGVAVPQDMAQPALDSLMRGILPFQVWTWIAVEASDDDAMSLSTAGVRPFLGFEMEVWNTCDLSRKTVQRFTSLMGYLLAEGPILGDGDTIGNPGAEDFCRCTLAASKTDRYQDADVPALLLEIGNKGGSAPRHDAPVGPGRAGEDPLASLRPVAAEYQPPVAAPARPVAVGERPVFGRRVGGFGRKGL